MASVRSVRVSDSAGYLLPAGASGAPPAVDELAVAERETWNAGREKILRTTQPRESPGDCSPHAEVPEAGLILQRLQVATGRSSIAAAVPNPTRERTRSWTPLSRLQTASASGTMANLAWRH